MKILVVSFLFLICSACSLQKVESQPITENQPSTVEKQPSKVLVELFTSEG